MGPSIFPQQRFGIVPGKRDAHNFRQRYRLLRGNPFRARHRSVTRRQRIPRLQKIVSDRPALDVRFRTPRPVGIHRALGVTVFSRIGIYKDSRGAQAFGSQRLESAIAVGIRITHQHDFPAHINSMLPQIFVIFRIAAVRVNHRRRHFARSRIAQIRAINFRIFGVRVHIVGGFAQPGAIVSGLHHLE